MIEISLRKDMTDSSLINFRNEAIQENIKVVSVDCFDTLLLREPKSESKRFLEISSAQIASLNKKGICCHSNANDLRNLRINITREWNKDKHFNSFANLPMHQSILTKIVGEIGLPEKSVALMREAELNYELGVLRPNKKLIKILNELIRYGKRIILISDMYLSGDDISFLVEKLCINLSVARVYSSADFKMTKKSGRLYKKVLINENIKPQAMIHAGDNKFSDVIMAKKYEIYSIHTPRGWIFNLINFSNKVLDRLNFFLK